MPDEPVLLDTVVLSNFLLAGAPELLLAVLAGRGLVTSEVLDENAAGRRAGHEALAGLDALLVAARPATGAPEGLGETALRGPERETYRELISFLGRGEASCIAVALGRGGAFASDDRVAREAARSRGVAVTGTIGLLLAGIRRGLVEPEGADAILERMVRHGFRSPVRSVRMLVG